MKETFEVGCAGSYLLSQHSGGRDIHRSELEASLLYIKSSRKAKAIDWNLSLKKRSKEKERKKIRSWRG